MSLGERIKLARLNKGLTQVKLAELISTDEETISDSAISNWEQNINKPHADLIAYLCEILDVDANYLLGVNKIKDTSKLKEIEDEFNLDEIEVGATKEKLNEEDLESIKNIIREVLQEESNKN